VSGPIQPYVETEQDKRATRASREFENAFGREPEAGDILRYRHIELAHHPDLISAEYSLFIDAWKRVLPQLPCPLGVEEGRIFRSVLPQTAPTPLYAEVREEKGERWIEDVYIQAQSFWHCIERDTLAQCGPTISARDMPTIAAIVFLGVGRHESYGRVEHKHLCRPATDEELRQPEPEPSAGILKLLRHAGCY
jgi:hypothetical protein